MKSNGKVDVVFAVPALNSSVSIEHYRSMMRTEWLLWGHEIAVGHADRCGDPYLPKVRSKMASDFLRDYPDTENFFFLDDDIGWPAEKVLEFLQRPDDVIAGIYPLKSEELDFPVELASDQNGALIESEGLLMAHSVPTGFLRIKRHVLEKIAATARVFTDIDATPAGTRVAREYFSIFESGPGPDGRFWGEDFAFCQRWRSMGGTIWVDPNIAFTHRGQRKWGATMSDHIGVFRQRAAEGARLVQQAAE